MSFFDIEITNDNDFQIINIKGYLDAHTTPELESRLQKLLSENRYKWVINLNNLDYIASAGLGVFMEFVESLRNQAGDLVFCCANEKIYKIFDLLGFPMIFKFYSTTEEAMQFFADKGSIA